jgi:hypothetical protein
VIAALLLFLCLAAISLMGLAAWLLILPPKPDYSGDDFELENLRTEGRTDAGHITER